MMVKTVDSMIGDLVGTFTDPIIVMPGGWGDTLPEWIKAQITLDRLVENIKTTRGQQPTGTDAEATAYLYTASLTAPMSGDWAKIYLYLAGKTLARASRGKDLPEDIKVESLDKEQLDDLSRLKEWLYRQRIQVRRERERAQRREEKAEAEARAPKQLGLPR